MVEECVRDTMTGTRRAIRSGLWLWFVGVIGIVSVSCGPCASLQREFDARMRHELQYLAVDDRVETSGPPHGYLHMGADAFEIVSASALKGEEPYFRTVTVQVPRDIWGYEGQIRLETSIRLDHIDADFKGEAWGPHDVALDADVMVRARIEVPGKRARWTWYARAAIQTELLSDATAGDVVEVGLENARLAQVEPNLPWVDEDMPEAIDELVTNGIADAVDAVLLEHQDARFAVMRVHPLNLTSMSFAVRVASADVDAARGVVSIAFHSALRPTMSKAEAMEVGTSVELPEDGVVLQLPRATLDAAVRQQSLRGTTPTSVRMSEDDTEQWQAFWGDSAFEDGMWSGIWRLWGLEGHPCRAKDISTVVRVSEDEGLLMVSRDALEDVAAPDDGRRDGPHALAELQRSTLSDMTREILRWFADEDQSDALRTVLEDAQFHENHLDARYSLQ